MAIPPIKVEVSADTSKLKDGLDKGTAQLDKFSKASKASTRKIEQFNDALAETDGRLGDAAFRVQTATHNFRNFSAVVGRTPAIIGAVTVGLVALAVTGFIAATAAAVSFANRLKEVSDQARELNMPTDELSRLKFAADAAGAGSATLTSGLETLKEAMNAVKTGEDDNSGAKALEVMGIKALDASGKLRPMSEVLSEVAGKFATYSDGANKTALATALFGEEIGGKLIPLLNKGAAGVDELKAKADELGVTMTDKSLPAVQKYEQATATLKATWEGLVNRIGEWFIPALADMVTAIANVSNELIKGATAAMNWYNNLSFVQKSSQYLDSISAKFAASVTYFREAFKAKVGEEGAAAAKFQSTLEKINKTLRENIDLIDGTRKPQPKGQNFAGWNDGAEMGFDPTAPAIPTDKTKPTKGGGGAAAAKTDPNVALLQRLAERAKIIEESYMTEEQKLVSKQEREAALLEQAHALEMQMLGENNEEKAVAEEMHLKRMEELNANHQKALAKLQMQRQNQTLTATAGFFGSLVTLMDSFGKKNTGLAKAFGIAQAIINTYQGVAAALASPVGPPTSWIMAATSLAKGMAAVAAIARVNTSGGGNSVAGGGGAVASAGGGGGTGAASTGSQGTGRAVYVNLQGTTFGREQVRELVEQIGQYQADGGKVIFA